MTSCLCVEMYILIIRYFGLAVCYAFQTYYTPRLPFPPILISIRTAHTHSPYLKGVEFTVLLKFLSHFL